MKKLIVFAVVLFSVVSVFASEWQSVIYDNQVNDICIAGDTVYTATNGGIEVFGKDGKKVFGANNLPWEIYTTVNSSLPKNFVHSLAVNLNGDIYAMGNNWFAHGINTVCRNIPAQDAEDVVIGPDGIKWAVLTINNRFGLYRDGGMGWEYVSLSKGISGSINRIAVGGYGKGKDSMFCTVWGTRSGGIFCYDAITGTEKDWKLGDQLIAGSPFKIAAWGDTVVVGGESGIYVATAGTASSFMIIAYDPVMPQNNGGAVAYYKGRYYVGEGSGGLWSCSRNSPWQSQVFDPSSGWSGDGINCLTTDGEKLYIGTNYHVWVYDGKAFTTLAITGLQYPHNNDIQVIAPDNTGRILVGTSQGGYRYDDNTQSPSLNNSAQNVSGNIITYFSDRYGVEWIGRVGSFERITMNGQSQIFDGGTAHEMFTHPYWFVGNVAGDVMLVTSSNNKVWSYAGQGTWAGKMDEPTRMTKENILSAKSTGKHLFIATDSAAYIYDFMGMWVTEKLGYATDRIICGIESTMGTQVWIAEPNSIYTVNGGIGIHGPCPWSNRVINDMVYDVGNYRLLVATDSGVYCYAAFGTTSMLPLTYLADRQINTIYIDTAWSSIWLGTKGGLTVWHRVNPTSARPAVKTGMRNLPLSSGQDVAYFDLSGRKINPSIINNLARGQIVFCRVNGVTKMNLNLNRLR